MSKLREGDFFLNGGFLRISKLIEIAQGVTYIKSLCWSLAFGEKWPLESQGSETNEAKAPLDVVLVQQYLNLLNKFWLGNREVSIICKDNWFSWLEVKNKIILASQCR